MGGLENKKIAVVGLGKSGAAAAKFCRGQGAVVRVMDNRNIPELEQSAAELNSMGINVDLGGHNLRVLQESQWIILSPGVPHDLPEIEAARSKGVRVIGEIELAAGFIQQPIVAVTGTNGKSTVTELIGDMLLQSHKKVFVGGNIGRPLIELVDQRIEAEVVVAEVSSFQLDTIENFKPAVSVLLNITEDHLDRYADFKAYSASKARIFMNQTAEDTAVINPADPATAPFISTIKARKLYIDDLTGSGSFEQLLSLCRQWGKVETTLNCYEELAHQCPVLPGGHNCFNVAAAAVSSAAAGASFEGIIKGLINFRGLKHRIEYVDCKNGVRFYDDSKATNLDAARKAIEAFSVPIILIMGGRGKGYGFEGLYSVIQRQVKKLVLIGETSAEIARTVGRAAQQGYVIVDGMERAVEEAFKAAEPGEVVLLAPACASFDMFTGYAERGEKFCQAVRLIL